MFRILVAFHTVTFHYEGKKIRRNYVYFLNMSLFQRCPCMTISLVIYYYYLSEWPKVLEAVWKRVVRLKATTKGCRFTLLFLTRAEFAHAQEPDSTERKQGLISERKGKTVPWISSVLKTGDISNKQIMLLKFLMICKSLIIALNQGRDRCWAEAFLLYLSNLNVCLYF